MTGGRVAPATGTGRGVGDLRDAPFHGTGPDDLHPLRGSGDASAWKPA